MILWRNSCYRTFYGPILHFLTTFYFTYTIRCNQKAEERTTKSLIIRISPQYLCVSQNSFRKREKLGSFPILQDINGFIFHVHIFSNPYLAIGTRIRVPKIVFHIIQPLIFNIDYFRKLFLWIVCTCKSSLV